MLLIAQINPCHVRLQGWQSGYGLPVLTRPFLALIVLRFHPLSAFLNRSAPVGKQGDSGLDPDVRRYNLFVLARATAPVLAAAFFWTVSESPYSGFMAFRKIPTENTR